MKIKKIISGGQTGADQGGLEAGKELKIETGGTAPLGFRTENGSDLRLKSKFNLSESVYYEYPPRTKLNIIMSDGTIIFGSLTGGSKLTLQLCQKFDKPAFVIPVNKDLVSRQEMIKDVKLWLENHKIKCLNVAGNRESGNPGIQKFTREFILDLFKD